MEPKDPADMPNLRLAPQQNIANDLSSYSISI